MRIEQQGDFDEAVVGDLREVFLPPESFDMVYCSFCSSTWPEPKRYLTGCSQP
ncbi:MAG: class I SAM-dependent methyltransferase [Actinomycetota bacterium]|nr:class I SAM-dependent methyltransferase [Actinomycetota bacterium]